MANRWQQRLMTSSKLLHVAQLVLSVPEHHTARVLQQQPPPPDNTMP